VRQEQLVVSGTIRQGQACPTPAPHDTEERMVRNVRLKAIDAAGRTATGEQIGAGAEVPDVIAALVDDRRPRVREHHGRSVQGFETPFEVSSAQTSS